MEEPTIPKSIKILAIGNSFSDDATEHLFGILKDAGVEEVIIGNLYDARFVVHGILEQYEK